ASRVRMSLKTTTRRATLTRQPPASRISCTGWRRQFSSLPDDVIDRYRYYRDCGKTAWNTYLIPPSTFAAYGVRYLQKLQFDNSLASLRLWGFMLTESERLYRARQVGKKVVALMGDLGPLAPLVYAFPDTVAFYPECHWWTPFLYESNDLFDSASRRGIGEDCCFVRAALGAFAKNCYFPPPDLCIASAGATCDDMAAVIQGAYGFSYPFFWFEIPFRREVDYFAGARDANGILEAGNGHLKKLILRQIHSLTEQLSKTSGIPFTEENLRAAIAKINALRASIARTRQYAYLSRGAALPALEMMNLEFMAMAFYADLDEALDIALALEETARERHRRGETVTSAKALRIYWITPPADPILLNHLEDLGGQVVGSEYLINQVRQPLREDLPPLEAVAEGLMNMSLIGSSKLRAARIIEEAKEAQAEGVVISSIFASSHCASEDRIIAEEVRRELDLPVLAFDVVGPGKQRQQSQILNRLQAFLEVLQARRSK
ncbi:MAG TPA: 2-hydroxyacyl-CoA dehydratase family protein, partial [bacterium]